MAERKCYEVAAAASERLREEFPEVTFYILGGIATGALVDNEATIGWRHLVIPGSDSDLPLIRPNGKRRDIDILCATDSSALDGVKTVVEEAVAGDLEVSVFGFDRARPNNIYNRALNSTARYWTSRREIGEDGVLRHALYPFAARIPNVALGQWDITPANLPHIPMMHPLYHLYSYDLRSTGGPRPKDDEKIAKAREEVRWSVEHYMPEEELAEFEELRTMKDALIALRDGRLEDYLAAGRLTVGYRSKLTHWVEGMEGVVNVFQGPTMQRLVRPFVGQKK